MWLEWQRRWQARHLPPGPLRDFAATPLPVRRMDYREAEYLAIDLETTGLDMARDVILSIGFVAVRGMTVDLSTACHRVVRVDRSIPEASAVIHQITDDQSAAGLDLEVALAEMLEALAGRVMIAHHARIERGFLGRACRRCWRGRLLTRIVDTQALAYRAFERAQTPFRAGDLRLHALCSRYNLPRYAAHNALSDALAAAELFLAQAAYRERGDERLTLGDFLM